MRGELAVEELAAARALPLVVGCNSHSCFCCAFDSGRGGQASAWRPASEGAAATMNDEGKVTVLGGSGYAGLRLC